MDATCSGIQQLASMIHEYDTGSKVNLTSQTDNEEVGDIYSYLLKPINKAINKYGTDNLNNEE